MKRLAAVSATALAVFFAACTVVGSPAGYPDRASPGARQKLASAGIPYAEDAFLDKVREGDEAAVGLFLEAGMGADRRLAQRALCAALSRVTGKGHGHETIARLLLQSGAPANIRCTVAEGKASGETVPALVLAARASSVKLVRELVLHRADVNVTDLDGKTALLVAAGNGSADIVRELAARGADLEARDRFEHTALMRASSAEVVRTLVAAGARVNATDKYGRTALMCASAHARPKVIGELVAAGADVNATDRRGRSPLLHTAGRPEAIRALLAAGANANAREGHRVSALMYASMWGKPDGVNALLGAGADVNATDEDGRSALMIAAGMGKTRTVRALLTGGADVNAKDKRGRTALDYCLLGKTNNEVRTALLDAGATRGGR